MYIIHFITGAYTIQHIHYMYYVCICDTHFLCLSRQMRVRFRPPKKKSLIRNRKEANTSEGGRGGCIAYIYTMYF